MIAAGHFVLASYVLAAAMIAVAVLLVIAIVSSWRATRCRPIGVIEATRALVEAGVLSTTEGLDLLRRYEGELV